MKDLKEALTEEALKLIEEALKNKEESRPLFDMAKLKDDIDERLRAEGVPEGLISSFRAYHEARSEMRALGMKLVRDMIQVQPLPDGARPIYFRDPEVPEDKE